MTKIADGEELNITELWMAAAMYGRAPDPTSKKPSGSTPVSYSGTTDSYGLFSRIGGTASQGGVLIVIPGFGSPTDPRAASGQPFHRVSLDIATALHPDTRVALKVSLTVPAMTGMPFTIGRGKREGKEGAGTLATVLEHTDTYGYRHLVVHSSKRVVVSQADSLQSPTTTGGQVSRLVRHAT